MSNNPWTYYVLYLFSVLVASLSQVILKKSAMISYETRLKEYLNPYVIGAYFFFFGSSLLTTFSYKGVPLTMGPVLEATGYIYVGVLGMLILKERLSRRKIIGNLLIVAGIMIYAFL
ncbi:EamA family transporter [uncultured Acetobacterium sp.]|uniref:EamA family transporter n=1 Tax=uncultured Acetobacterium sp. TaxID=217139 RepID=UPI0025D9780E|nr:EamA family transporter [uncultured Acetobacterium sp.]